MLSLTSALFKALFTNTTVTPLPLLGYTRLVSWLEFAVERPAGPSIERFALLGSHQSTATLQLPPQEPLSTIQHYTRSLTISANKVSQLQLVPRWPTGPSGLEHIEGSRRYLSIIEHCLHKGRVPSSNLLHLTFRPSRKRTTRVGHTECWNDTSLTEPIEVNSETPKPVQSEPGAFPHLGEVSQVPHSHPRTHLSREQLFAVSSPRTATVSSNPCMSLTFYSRTTGCPFFLHMLPHLYLKLTNVKEGLLPVSCIRGNDVLLWDLQLEFKSTIAGVLLLLLLKVTLYNLMCLTKVSQFLSLCHVQAWTFPCFTAVPRRHSKNFHKVPTSFKEGRSYFLGNWLLTLRLVLCLLSSQGPP